VARYPLNQPIHLTTTVRDVTGTLVNATALTLLVKIAQADGTQLTINTYSSPSNDGTGLYHQDVPVTDLATAGHYQYTWTATGTGAGVSFGEFDVFDAMAETAVLPLQDAKDALNIPQADTSQDAEIQAYIATIGTSLEGLTGGPVVNRAVTAERCTFLGWYQALQVRQRPLVSVTAVTSVKSGTAVDISGGLDISAAGRTFRKKDGTPFSSDSMVVLVDYVAGWGTSVPAALNIFARIVLQHLWESQRGPLAMPMAGEQPVMVPGFGFAIPARAAELLQGTLNGIPFADQVFAW
jgi:hypothetical protein